MPPTASSSALLRPLDQSSVDCLQNGSDPGQMDRPSEVANQFVSLVTLLVPRTRADLHMPNPFPGCVHSTGSIFQRSETKRALDQLKARGRTDWDVLRENHRFLRDDAAADSEGAALQLPYHELLAIKYYNQLFKEVRLPTQDAVRLTSDAISWLQCSLPSPI